MVQDHPRICGEHRRDRPDEGRSGGSSPHMRGTLNRLWPQLNVWGIIPAYAGNTRIAIELGGLYGDHPRICGEHWYAIISNRHTIGSSPHMRGTPELLLVGADIGRIIPAYAGNTNAMSWVTPWREDHPRICGEHRDLAAVAFAWLGSSPHMRGTPWNVAIAWFPLRIIPAYAGNTIARIHRMAGTRDHPRICGEHRNLFDELTDGQGSSPHMRGTPSPIRSQKARAGIIPAYAGNTRSSPTAMARDVDHPRICGEHTSVGTARVSVKGSSPHMRGTPTR